MSHPFVVAVVDVITTALTFTVCHTLLLLLLLLSLLQRDTLFCSNCSHSYSVSHFVVGVAIILSITVYRTLLLLL